MKILIDADACPVVKQVEEIAKKHNIETIIFSDTSHIFNSDYCEVRVVDQGADAVDFAIMSVCKAGDIVVTQDYGVAAMALGKGAKAIHHSGMEYTDAPGVCPREPRESARRNPGSVGSPAAAPGLV